MNALDVLIFIALVYFVYKGAQNGLYGELLGMTGWLVAAILSLRYGLWASRKLENYIQLPDLAYTVLGYAAVLLAGRLLLQILLAGLRKAMDPKTHDSLNKLLGAVIGFAKGAFLVSIFVLALSIMPLGEQVKSYEYRSNLFPHMKKFAQVILRNVVYFVPQTKPTAPAPSKAPTAAKPA